MFYINKPTKYQLSPLWRSAAGASHKRHTDEHQQSYSRFDNSVRLVFKLNIAQSLSISYNFNCKLADYIIPPHSSLLLVLQL